MKILIVLLIALAVFLLFPTYDLVKEPPSFVEEVQPATVENGFLSLERCRQKAEDMKLVDYRCIKKRSWEGIFSNYHKYNYEPPRSDAGN